MTLRKTDCRCRGCRHPGRRSPLEILKRQPKSVAPTTHAQAYLGVEHGRMHDLATLEKDAYGEIMTPELILHFKSCHKNPSWLRTVLM